MKKLLSLVSISFLLKAEDAVESVGDEMIDAMQDLTSAANEMVSNLSWKMKFMLYWSSISFIHKMIIVGLGVIFILWIVCKLMHRRKDSCCK